MDDRPGRVVVHDVGLAAQHQHDRPPKRQSGQWLVGGIEQQNPAASPDVRGVLC